MKQDRTIYIKNYMKERRRIEKEKNQKINFGICFQIFGKSRKSIFNLKKFWYRN